MTKAITIPAEDRITAGDRVKISNSKQAVFWEVLGVRKPFKDMPNKICLIIKHKSSIRRNFDINKVCVLIKGKV